MKGRIPELESASYSSELKELVYAMMNVVCFFC
jgi:hypothetical protein